MDVGKEKLPFESDSVDIVFSYHTLEHIDGYLFCLAEIYRVLKHKGLFFISTKGRNPVRERQGDPSYGGQLELRVPSPMSKE